jgi:hypothetical protein
MTPLLLSSLSIGFVAFAADAAGSDRERSGIHSGHIARRCQLDSTCGSFLPGLSEAGSVFVKMTPARQVRRAPI